MKYKLYYRYSTDEVDDFMLSAWNIDYNLEDHIRKDEYPRLTPMQYMKIHPNPSHRRYKTAHMMYPSDETKFFDDNGIKLYFSNTMQTIVYAYLTEEEATLYRLKFSDTLHEL